MISLRAPARLWAQDIFAGVMIAGFAFACIAFVTVGDAMLTDLRDFALHPLTYIGAFHV